MVRLETSAAVIDALGGNGAVAALIGAKYRQRVSNWRKMGFPADTFLVLTQALAEKGFEAPPSLWDMREARP
jgi:hypothetical protein